MTQITRQMEGLQKASASIDRIAELLSTENAIVETAAVAIREWHSVKPSIDVDNTGASRGHADEK